MELNAKIPAGPINDKWNNHRFAMKLVNPANRRKYQVIVVGSGLAGGAAAATLGELGYNVKCFYYQDSARRAHSIAAQGGINAAKNYQNDGDSVFRLFYDTVKGGDFRSREANVYRLAELSLNIIDQCVAQGVPFAREYGGLLDNRSFGGAQVSRTFYARGQTGQQLLLGCYQALRRQIAAGTVTMYSRHEMLDLIVTDGRARGIVVRDLVTGDIDGPPGRCGGPVPRAGTATSSTFPQTPRAATSRPSGEPTSAAPVSPTPASPRSTPRASRPAGDYQSKLTLMSESLRNDGRIWAPGTPRTTPSPPATSPR
jgi:succinate dehydrogenase / fumarate reductase, flavoprotein subunit